MSALTVLQVCGVGIVILALAYLLGSDGNTTSTSLVWGSFSQA
jgi:hypothetical protein